MKKTVVELYALAVCFVAVVCFVVAAGMALYAVVGVANPGFTLNAWIHRQHQTNDEFFNASGMPAFPGQRAEGRVRPPEPELTRQRGASYRLALDNERRESIQTLVKTAIVMVLDVLVFVAHWALARRARGA